MSECEACIFKTLVINKQINEQRIRADLCSICLFKTLTGPQIDELIKICTIKQFHEGDILFSEEDEPSYLYLLLKGAVKEYKYDAYGNTVVVQHYFTPNMIGESANFEYVPYDTTAECINKCVVLTITYEDFEKKFLKNPDISLKLMLQLAKKIKTTMNYNMPKEAISKLAEFIYENEELFNTMKKYKIAEMLNISPETLSRLLKTFKEHQIFERKENGHYVLNGVKQFISSGSLSAVVVVLASTDRSRGARGISAFIVEKDTPGFSYGKEENKLGIRASTTTELVFEECKVPAENLMGKEGMGFIYTMRNFDRARPGVGAIALGIAQGAYELALEFIHQKNLLNNQYIQRVIADMATEVEAARALVYATARMIDAGGRNYTKEASFAKLYPADIAVKVANMSIELLGPYGLLSEYRVEKMLRDAKITQIYEGTNQIQRAQIAIELTREMGTKARAQKA